MGALIIRPGVYKVKIDWHYGPITEHYAFWNGEKWRFVKHSPQDWVLDIPAKDIVEVIEFVRDREFKKP